MKIYPDSCIFIYAIEGEPAKKSMAQKYLSSPEGSYIWVWTELTRAECLILPIREGNHLLIRQYEMLFSKALYEPLNRPIWNRAIDLRSRYDFRLPDALHLAAAIEGRCEQFITNDSNLTRCTEIKVVIINA